MKLNPRCVEKPRGHELFWAETQSYVGKILHVKAGESLSVQVHREKNGTLPLPSGEIRLRVGASSEEMILVPLALGESFRLVPGTGHRACAARRGGLGHPRSVHAAFGRSGVVQ